jgi:hypothetical protein
VAHLPESVDTIAEGQRGTPPLSPLQKKKGASVEVSTPKGDSGPSPVMGAVTGRAQSDQDVDAPAHASSAKEDIIGEVRLGHHSV